MKTFTRTRLDLIEYAAVHTLDEFLSNALDEIGAFVDSPIGFYHFVEDDQKTISRQQWSTRTLDEFCRADGKGLHHSLDLAGEWAECARRKKPVIHNDYASLKHERGIPEGHARVVRELTVPVIRKGKIVAILGVGNKPVDYTEKDAETVAFLADLTWEIAERKRAEDELKRLKANLSALIESTGDLIWSVDLDYKLVTFNKALRDAVFNSFGVEPHVGAHPEELIPPERARVWPPLYERAITEGAFHSEYELADGRILELSFNRTTHDGMATGIAVFGKDITEHKRAGEALRESEARFRSLFDNMTEGVALHEVIYDDSGTAVDYRILAANPAFEKHTGLSREKCKGQLASTLFSTDTAPYLDIYAQVADSGEPCAFETYFPPMERYFQISVSSPKQGCFVTVFENITGRKLAEEELRRSEERLKIVFESAPDPYYILDPSGKIVDANRTAVELAGYAMEDLVGKNLFELGILPVEQLPKAMEALALNAAGFPTGPDDYAFKRKDGTEVFFEHRSYPIRIEGRPLVLGIARDITKRKQAEEALKESHRQLANIIDFLPDATIVIDREGKVIAWNRAIEEMTGVKAADILGKGNYEYALPFYGERRPILIDLALQPQPEIEQQYAAFERTATVIAGETYMPALKGGRVFLFGTASALFDSRGNIVGAIESIRDITDRRRVEEALRASEAKFRSYIESAPLAIFVADRDGRIVDFNHAAMDLLGYDAADLKQMHILDMHPDEDRDEVLKEFAALLETGSFQTERRMKKGDRQLIWVHLNAIMLSNGFSLGYWRDITERKRVEAEKESLEAQLAQAQKLEAVGTLAGGIAHDFNNILAPIIGYAEMALNELPQSDPMRFGQEQILTAGFRAKDLVKQILAFGRPGRDQQKEPVGMSSIVKEALKLLRASLPSSIKIVYHIENAVANADPTQIHQVLMNLCTNAAHAMDNKGILEIRLSRVNLTESDLTDESIVDLKPGPHLKLSVSDTGIGMDKATLERIFDPYFTTKEVGKGTGLGLAVVHGIVKHHHGAITVRSEFGKGSTFGIYIPAVEYGVEMADETRPVLPTGTERILFVDDERSVVEMGTAVLERLGYQVTPVTNSLRTLEIFRSRPHEFDLVITDYTMPNLTGLDLVKEIRRIRPDVPVILCTGFSEEVSKETAIKLDIELIMKPFGLTQFAELIRKVLDLPKS